MKFEEKKVNISRQARLKDLGIFFARYFLRPSAEFKSNKKQ